MNKSLQKLIEDHPPGKKHRNDSSVSLDSQRNSRQATLIFPWDRAIPITGEPVKAQSEGETAEVHQWTTLGRWRYSRVQKRLLP